jgi:hypothetical protein
MSFCSCSHSFSKTSIIFIVNSNWVIGFNYLVSYFLHTLCDHSGPFMKLHRNTFFPNYLLSFIHLCFSKSQCSFELWLLLSQSAVGHGGCKFFWNPLVRCDLNVEQEMLRIFFPGSKYKNRSFSKVLVLPFANFIQDD